MLTFKNLKYLVQLTKDLNFNQAANNSFVAQSSLSSGIKSLEKYLDTQLFIRDNKKVIITPIGREISNKAERILTNLKEIEMLAKRDFFNSEINIGIIPTISPYLLSGFIKNIKNQYPKLKVNIAEDTSDNLIRKVNKMQVDFAIFAMPYDLPENIKHKMLFKDKLIEIAHKYYKNKDLLLLEEGHCLREHILNSAKINKEKILKFNCSSISTLVAMVDLGLGVSFLPEMAIKSEVAKYPEINTKETNYYRSIGIIYHEGYIFVPEILELIKLIKS